METRTRTCLTVAALRRSIIYQPLALTMAFLMLPSLSWVEGGNKASPFEASAQIVPPPPVQGCVSTTNSIIQNYCTPAVGNQGVIGFYPALSQLETDAVNAYLAAHNLPETDSRLIYDYGRADLRNAIRGHIISILLGVIATPASSRTPHQRTLYQWLQNLVWTQEIADYTESYNEFLKWQSNPCRYTLDPQIASQYGLSYNGAAFCGVSQSSVFNTVIPAPSYFKAVGLKKSYQAWADKITCPVNASGVQDRSCKVAFQEATLNTSLVAGIATAAGAIVTGAATTALAASAYAAYAAYAVGFTLTPQIATGGGAVMSAAFAVSGTSVASVGGFILGFAAPAIVILTAVAIGITAGVKVFEYELSAKDLNDLKNQITSATNAPPDLNGMATDTTGRGLFKIQNAIMPQTLKTRADGTLIDLPSTTPLPSHRLGTDREFDAGSALASTNSTLSFKGWNGEVWSAQTWGGWFVQTCAAGPRIDDLADGTCVQTDSFSADLHYIDHRFRQYLSGLPGSGGISVFALSRFSAARFGDKFFATRAGGSSAGAAFLDGCPARMWMGGISGSSDEFLKTCWSYVDTQVPMVASDGSRKSASFVDGLSSTFTSSPVMAFGPGIASTQTITVAGNPTPVVCIVSSNLPANFKINVNPTWAWAGTTDCGSSSGFLGFRTVGIQLEFDGLLNAPIGTYLLVLKAANNIYAANARAVTQTFTINVSPQLSIISPDTMNVTTGVPANFTVVATGTPSPKLSVDGVNLGGMTFTDNGNGTATISGIDTNTFNFFDCTVASGGTSGQPCAIVATNSQGTYRQPFRVNVSNPPTAVMVCNPCSATFTANAGNRVILTSSGATTPVSWLFGDSFTPGPPPYPWLSLKDNGDGTAVLSGTPPLGAVGPFTFYVGPYAQFTNRRLFEYTINVSNNAVFTSPNIIVSNANSAPGGTGGAAKSLTSFSMTAGRAATSGPFTISANTGTISIGSLLPAGLSFTSFGNTATISGTPAVGSGGQYVLRLSDDGGTAGTAAQQLILNVNETPKITSNGTATMFAGMPGSFAVTTTGFPSVSEHVIPVNPLPPTDPSAGDGMYFAVTGLPAGLQASNLNPAGFATGTLTIQGTPSAANIGTHQVRITAVNGVGTGAQQTLTLNIVGITGPAPASGTTCNGNYNGTFRGSITVSAGQNCAFYSGGVTGNVSVDGGHLALTNATVTGNMSIQGGSGFSIGTGTTINGNLSIESVASGSSRSMICQAKIGGNLQVSNNAVPINIGSPQTFCYGNSFGGNVEIQGNTAPVAVHDNTISKNLSCSGNSAITGSGNAAAKKNGQCSGF